MKIDPLNPYKYKRQAERKANAYKAYQIFYSYLRKGKIKRQPCIDCGKSKSEAHHPDYNYPLRVMWLCRKHHAEEHNNLIKMETMMKQRCAWCLVPINNTPDKYARNGNMCAKCSLRVTYVLIKGWSNKNKISPEEADRQLEKERNKNIKLYGEIN